MVKEDEDVVVTLCPLQACRQPGELLLAHAYQVGTFEPFFPGLGITLVAVEHDEGRVLVPEPVPQRPEVGLVVLLVMPRRLRVLPIDVVVAGDRIPRHGEPGHGLPVLTHLLQPLRGFVIALDQIAHSHHEIRVEEVGLLYRLS